MSVNLEEIKSVLKNRLKHKRYIHSLGVERTAVELAKIYGVSCEQVSIAGLLHDYAKNLSDNELRCCAKEFEISIDDVFINQKGLLHGFVGAELIKKDFNIKDDEIINAIRYHTTGRGNMTLMEKIIYLADYIEPNRNFEGVENIRSDAFENIDHALISAFDHTINYVILKGELIHPLTITARNDILMKLKDF
ncbi:bis(5'-nucleosyl)-tetraphosphatase (symmetrical) YqeK [Lutibacter sp. B2]|nr:bis(5'-nucleosyl)-tetraphosphatase (symmetrical) YqeK [Lutibacter sp. B2]